MLLGRPLPGKEQPLSFPDLGFLLRQDVIPLLDENLATGVALPASPRPLRVVSSAEVLELAREEDVAYLAFQPAQIEDDRVTLTLAALMASASPDRRPLGLSAVRVTFRRGEAGWEVVGEPVMSAA